jgi:hypothetical protein
MVDFCVAREISKHGEVDPLVTAGEITRLPMVDHDNRPRSAARKKAVISTSCRPNKISLLAASARANVGVMVEFVVWCLQRYRALV